MDKEELKDLIGLTRRVKNEEARLEELKDKVTSIAIDYGEKVQISPTNMSMETVAEMIDLKALIEADLLTLYQKRKEAYILFSSLKGIEREVMELRYVYGFTWERIAVELELSYRHVHRVHGNALYRLSKTDSMSEKMDHNM